MKNEEKVTFISYYFILFYLGRIWGLEKSDKIYEHDAKYVHC